MTDPETTVIDSKIDELTRQAAEDRKSKATADDKFTDTENRLTALRAAQREIDANQKAYETAYPDLRRGQKSFEDFRSTEKTTLEGLLKEHAREVRQKSAALQTTLATLRQEVDTKAGELQTAEAARDAAKTTVKAKTDLAGQYKKLAASVTARHNSLKTSRDEIDKVGNERQYALAYLLLIRGFTDLLNAAPKLIEPADLPKKLLEALEAQSSAEADLVKQERAVADAKIAYTDAQAALEDHIKNGEIRLREQLKKIPAPEDKSLDQATAPAPDREQDQTPGQAPAAPPAQEHDQGPDGGEE
ncbi:hypothetical protein [Streptomyces sp. NPDC057302]|uniref:hypothetical protein n=1 Tax=Streptomyces sp. NPDC057302 TaxID=3346094 RepID=UPI0036292AA5